MKRATIRSGNSFKATPANLSRADLGAVRGGQDGTVIQDDQSGDRAHKPDLGLAA